VNILYPLEMAAEAPPRFGLGRIDLLQHHQVLL
jgi:hypothetical protein